MDEPLIEFLIGGVVLYLAIRWKMKIVEKLFAGRAASIARIVCHLVLGLIAMAILVDPLLPGRPIVEIHAPSRYPTTLDHLRVYATPIGYRGAGDAERVVSAAFDERGVAVIEQRFEMLESRMRIVVEDQSEGGELRSQTVHVSPFVRHQLWHLVVRFDD